MALRTLLVSHDGFLESAFGDAIRFFQGELQFAGDRRSAEEILRRERFDLVVIDCDDLYGGAQLIRQTRACLPNRSSVLLAVTNGGMHPADAMDLGANLVSAKPYTPESARRELERVWRRLDGDQRSDPRFELQIPALVSFGHVSDRRAEIFNISRGGVGLRIPESTAEDDLLHLRCFLPGALVPLQAYGEIAWADRAGNCGLRFLGMSDGSRRVLSDWLEQAGKGAPCLAATRGA
jgi:DNA-binding response OmpR family regulator